MGSSLLRFSNRATDRSANNLHWGRVGAGADPFPFRGQQVPNYTEDEFEQRVIRVADAKNGFFDVSDPTQNKQFLDVMECCFNQWFQLTYLERFWVDGKGNRTTLHYVEWVEYYLEDGSRAPYRQSGIKEIADVQDALALPPGG